MPNYISQSSFCLCYYFCLPVISVGKSKLLCSGTKLTSWPSGLNTCEDIAVSQKVYFSKEGHMASFWVPTPLLVLPGVASQHLSFLLAEGVVVHLLSEASYPADDICISWTSYLLNFSP